jgi:trehalose 6-phosphate synthase/phosphatase
VSRLRPGIKPKFEALQKLYEGKKIIVGRDKLDPVTGVIQKVRSFFHLLVCHCGVEWSFWL